MDGAARLAVLGRLAARCGAVHFTYVYRHGAKPTVGPRQAGMPAEVVTRTYLRGFAYVAARVRAKPVRSALCGGVAGAQC